jgi:SAM-dependent methyltransferase
VPVYDQIGQGYPATRQPDARIARAIRRALGDARQVVNVGAGSGSYESTDLTVVAVDSSHAMLGQRPPGAAPAIQAVAEHLPFADKAFDAALAVLTLHHWDDLDAGLAELCRVIRDRVVIVTWDPAARDRFWLTTEYFPTIVEFDLRRFPGMERLAAQLPHVTVEPLLIPHDCQDGFLGAFWRRPEAYLDPAIRQAMSGFAQLPDGAIAAGLARLADDLQTGRWDARFGALAALETVDLGYRIVIARKRR